MKKIIKITLLSTILSISASAAMVKMQSNIRENPTVKSKIIDTIQKGADVKVVQEIYNEKRERWYKLENGYIASWLFVLKANEIEKNIERVKNNDTNKTISKEIEPIKDIPQEIIEEPKNILSVIDNNNSKIEKNFLL